MPKITYSPYSTFDSSKPLSSVYKKRAASELGEVSEQISAHVESFRRWLDSMPHLKCTKGKSTRLNLLGGLDETFLLSFLRHAKYNHMKAQRRLDNFCTFRTSATEGVPQFFQDLTERRNIWKKFIDMK